LRAGGWGRLVFAAMIAVALGLHWLMLKYYPIDSIRRGWDYAWWGEAKMDAALQPVRAVRDVCAW